MDGLMFVMYFAPAVIVGSMILSMLGFVLAFWAGFGLQVEAAVLAVLNIDSSNSISSQILTEGSGDPVMSSFLARSGILGVLARPPLHDTYIYALWLNLITVASVVATYSLGRVIHGKRGWRFIQPMTGGVRFVLLQSGTWVSLAFSLILPWMAFEDLGLLALFGLVLPPVDENQNAHGGLLVAGAAVGMLAEVFAFISLVAYDPRKNNIRLRSKRQRQQQQQQNNLTRENVLRKSTRTNESFVDAQASSDDSYGKTALRRRVIGKPLPPSSPTSLNEASHTGSMLHELEVGQWQMQSVLGQSQAWWWVFLGLQICIVLFSCSLAVLAEIELSSRVIQGVLVVVFVLMLATAVSLTNTVGGKWRYGERTFLLLMPFRGGLAFTLLQGLGWMLFSMSMLLSIFKFAALIVPAFELFVFQYSVVVAGGLGLLAELLLATSLLVFDPAKSRHCCGRGRANVSCNHSASAGADGGADNGVVCSVDGKLLSVGRRSGRSHTRRSLVSQNSVERNERQRCRPRSRSRRAKSREDTERTAVVDGDGCADLGQSEGSSVSRVIGKREVNIRATVTAGLTICNQYLVEWAPSTGELDIAANGGGAPVSDCTWVDEITLVTRVICGKTAVEAYEKQRHAHLTESHVGGPALVHASSAVTSSSSIQADFYVQRSSRASDSSSLSSVESDGVDLSEEQTRGTEVQEEDDEEDEEDNWGEEHGDWQECEDELGNVFFFNTVTRESSHVHPAGLVAA